MRAGVVLLLIGCGASPSTTPSPPGPSVPAPVPADAATSGSPDAAVEAILDAAPAPTATLDGIVVAGELDVAKVADLLSGLTPQLASCLGDVGPTTTELSLTIVKSAIGIRNAWQNDVPVVPACLRAIFDETPERAWNVGSTMVYVVVKAGPPGAQAPDAPPLRERRAEFARLYCDLEKLSGAESLDAPQKQNKMLGWARDHIKHPAPLQLASDVSTWNPAERADKLIRAIKAEGIKKCALQRF